MEEESVLVKASPLLLWREGVLLIAVVVCLNDFVVQGVEQVSGPVNHGLACPLVLALGLREGWLVRFTGSLFFFLLRSEGVKVGGVDNAASALVFGFSHT